MRISRVSLAAGITIILVCFSVVAGRVHVSAAQDQVAAKIPAAPPPPPHGMQQPINLRVLPRNLTGQQVHEIMEKWEGDLGANCKTCHAEDPKNIGPNGKPRLNFADDSKPEKATARKMYKMTEEINAKYIAKIDSSGEPVTCGTCHRGHLGPEPFTPKEEHEHDHDHAH